METQAALLDAVGRHIADVELSLQYATARVECVPLATVVGATVARAKGGNRGEFDDARNTEPASGAGLFSCTGTPWPVIVILPAMS